MRMVGGLGNQLYQLSYGLQLKYYFDDALLFIDYSSMRNYTESWGLLVDKVVDFDAINNIKLIKGGLFVTKLRLPRLMGGVVTNVMGLASVLSDVNADTYTNISSSRVILLDGYFEKSRSRYKGLEIIRNNIKSDLYNDRYKDVSVINIRGGEYARLGLSKPEDVIFYNEAIRKIEQTHGRQNWLVITDDVQYSYSILKNLNIAYEIMSPNPIENFSALMSAKYKILSRSTFSKWAGALSKKNCECYFISPF